jgi:tetratricopeptide (TPR) repeat protein
MDTKLIVQDFEMDRGLQPPAASRPDYSVDKYARIGNDFFQRGMYADAAEAYEVSVSKDPARAVSLCNLGITCMLLKRWERAEETTRRYLELAVGDLQASIRLGMIQRERGRHEESIRTLRHTLTLDSRAALVHRELGLSLLAANLIEEARDAFRRALQLQPAMVDAWCGLGRVYERLKLTDPIRKHYEQALRHVPSDQSGPIYAQLGRFHRRQKDWPHAHFALAKAIAKGESDPRLIVEFGYVLLKMGKKDEALEQAQILDAMGSEYGERIREAAEGRPVRHGNAGSKPEAVVAAAPSAAIHAIGEDEDTEERPAARRMSLSEVFEKTFEGDRNRAAIAMPPGGEPVPELSRPGAVSQLDPLTPTEPDSASLSPASSQSDPPFNPIYEAAATNDPSFDPDEDETPFMPSVVCAATNETAEAKDITDGEEPWEVSFEQVLEPEEPIAEETTLVSPANSSGDEAEALPELVFEPIGEVIADEETETFDQQEAAGETDAVAMTTDGQAEAAWQEAPQEANAQAEPAGPRAGGAIEPAEETDRKEPAGEVALELPPIDPSFEVDDPAELLNLFDQVWEADQLVCQAAGHGAGNGSTRAAEWNRN